MNNVTKKKRMSWGIGVAVLYGSFVLFILTFVFYASFQNFDLVEEDYYAQELAYQDQIDRIVRTKSLPAQPRIEYQPAEKIITLSFPDIFSPDSISGTLMMFRPSNARWDKTIPVKLGTDGRQVIPAQWLIKGKWRTKLDWVVGELEYYHEDLLIVQ